MARKYAGPLQPGRRSAKVTKTTKSKTRVDKKQDNQIHRLQKDVKKLKGASPTEQAEYERGYTPVYAMGTSANMTNLINYDNEINYTGSDIQSRTFKSLNCRIHIRGDQSGASANDSHRPVRVIFFLYKCDVVNQLTPIPGNYVIEPQFADLFDGVNVLSDANLAMSRMSFRNRNRIKVLKDYCFSLTNHSGTEADKILNFRYYFKHKQVYENVNKFDDSVKEASYWMPYVIVMDPHSTNRANWTMINQVKYSTEK